MAKLEEYLKEIAVQLQVRNKIEAKDWMYYNHCLESALKELKLDADMAPVVHGRWETNSDRPDTLICSVCKCGFDMWKHEPHRYCPNCGAKMDL